MVHKRIVRARVEAWKGISHRTRGHKRVNIYPVLKNNKCTEFQNRSGFIERKLGDEQSVSDYYGEITKKLMQEFQLMSSLKGNSNIVSYEDHDIKQHEDGIG